MMVSQLSFEVRAVIRRAASHLVPSISSVSQVKRLNYRLRTAYSEIESQHQFSSVNLTSKAVLMAQAVVDPEQLRQFAAMLKRYTQQVRESTVALTQAQARLAESWRDQEHRKFADDFEEQIKLVHKLLESSEHHIPYLLKKADIIDEYLQR